MMAKKWLVKTKQIIINFLSEHASWQKYLVVLLFALYFVIGVVVVGDYGTSYDEHIEHETSMRQYRFAVSKIYHGLVKKQVPGFEFDHVWYQNYLQGTGADKYYGTFLQLPAVIWEHLHNFSLPPRDIYYTRHLLNFTYFFLATICFYRLLKDRFGKRWLAFLGVLAVVLTPRFFAESFYNNKDILFASTYIITIYFGLKFIHQPSGWRMLLTSLITAIAMNTRVAALIIPVMLLAATFVQALKTKKWSTLALSCGYVLLTLTIYIVIHPSAWGNEIGFLGEVLQHFSHTNIYPVLYYGQLLAGNLPWHYTLGYVWATTPLIFTALMVMGLIFYARRIGKNLRHGKVLVNQDDLLLVFALVPVLMTIILKSNLTNGWRHSYFIYFPLVYFLVYGLSLVKKQRLKIVAFTILAGGLLLNLHWIITRHPHQFIYYNPIVRGRVVDNFDRDYYILTAKDLYQAMVADATANGIEKPRVAFGGMLKFYLDRQLSGAEMDRYYEIVEDDTQADYVGEIYLAGKPALDVTGFIPIHEVVVDGIPLATLFRRQPGE